MVTDLEMNYERDCRLKNWQCDKCEKRAVMECELNMYNHGDVTKGYGVYCKDHFDSLFEDTINDLQDGPQPDVDDLED